MGTCSYCCIGVGMTEKEAERDARQQASACNGHQDGYSGDINSARTMNAKCIKQPKPAKRCTVEKTVQKGAKKWGMVFVIEPKNTFGRYGSSIKNSKTEAIQMAKELALRHNMDYSIKVEKRLINGNPEIACVKPKKSEMGEWKFWGEARE